MGMQPLARDGLTAAQVTGLLQDAPAQELTGGLELVDLSLAVLEDISGDLAGGSVSRNSYAELHATADLRITRVLEWGSALVRPYMVVSDGTLTARFNLGVYHPTTPANSAAETPTTFAVQGYDILLRLAQPVGDAYALAAGEPYLAKVEEILVARGYLAYSIDPAAAATVAPSARVWAFDDQVTWLTVVNDMLASIGYAGIWSDWDGRLRCEPYILPQFRAVEWTYTDDQATTMLGTDRAVERDFFRTPNKWVAYRTNMADDAPPVEGAGVYTFTNQSTGDTSVEGRGGLEITRMLPFDAANQAALQVQADAAIQADMDVPTIYSVATAANPATWHFDRLFVEDASLLPFADVQCTSWSLLLPPDLGEMTQQWRVIAR